MLFQTQESRCKYRLIPGCLCFHDRKGSLEGICNGYSYVENLKFLVGLVSFVYFCSLMQLLKTLMADPLSQSAFKQKDTGNWGTLRSLA